MLLTIDGEDIFAAIACHPGRLDLRGLHRRHRKFHENGDHVPPLREPQRLWLVVRPEAIEISDISVTPLADLMTEQKGED